MMERSKLLKWFHDEATERGVFRCLPCFKIHIAAKPNLQHLTPFKAQQLLNISGNGALSTGILTKKEKDQTNDNRTQLLWPIAANNGFHNFSADFLKK